MTASLVSEAAAERGLWLGFDACEALLADQRLAAAQRYGRGALDLIDLPEITSGPLDPSQIRAAGVMYWASEVEAAGILPFVEVLTERLVRGELALSIAGTSGSVLRFWRGREQRFDAHQRRMLFSRLFGGPGAVDPNEAFPEVMQRFVAALSEIGRHPSGEGTRHLEMRANVVARELGTLVGGRAGGIMGYAARDLIAANREALSLLRSPVLRDALGGGTPVQILHRHAPSILGRATRTDVHLTRAEAGAALITWIADHASALERGSQPIRRNDPVIAAAERWRSVAGAG